LGLGAIENPLNKEKEPNRLGPVKSNYKLIVYDFDGVLTDNRVWVSETGEETVACNRSDGWWIGQIRDLGVEQIILSTETNPVVSARGKKLKIEVHQGKQDKAHAFRELVKKRSLSFEQVVYIGNDMNDWGCFENAGFTFAPEDSHPKILQIAKQVIPVKGGAGIVRFVYDWLVQG